MSWYDDLLPASFRGVEFQYLDTRRGGGRRLALHDFPLREDNFVEDLGKKSKVHRIVGYVLGDNYFADRDALEEALEASGSATLVHPFKGNLTVACEEFNVLETVEEGGIARFEMVFVEAGKQPSPTSSSSTALTAADAGLAQEGLLSQDFGALYVLDGLPGFIRSALSGNVFALVDDLTALVGYPGLLPGMFDSQLQAIMDAVEDPLALGFAIAGFFTDYSSAATGILPVYDPHVSSRGLPLNTDISFGLAAYGSWGADLAPVIGTTPERLQQRADQALFVNLVRGAAVSAMAQLYANTTFVSAADAEAARDQLTDMIDVQATAAGDNGDDVLFNGWMTVFRAVSTDLTSRAQQLPELLNYAFQASLPAVAVSQRIYQDGSRAPELIARNAAPHPLFMPLKIEALAA